MEVGDLHVGKQLQVVSNLPGGVPGPSNVAHGAGAAAIPGSAWIDGSLHVGSPVFLTAETCVGFARPPATNTKAALVKSILAVTSRGFSPTPVDILFGDPGGPVGITCFTEIINISNNTSINILSPVTSGTGILNWFGVKTLTGAESLTGAKAQAGKEARSGAKVDNGSRFINGYLNVSKYVVASQYFGDISQCSGKKDFDIPHPTKDGWRLRHVCIEGPTADVYVRGKLKDSNVIHLPDYWLGLVDPETITINITPVGTYQELFVEKIEWGSKVTIKNNAGSSINCHYTISGERIDVEKNIPEYEGTYEDYPGDNSEYMNTVRILPMEN
jgi:hypothetical protein